MKQKQTNNKRKTFLVFVICTEIRLTSETQDLSVCVCVCALCTCACMSVHVPGICNLKFCNFSQNAQYRIEILHFIVIIAIRIEFQVII